MKRILNKIFNWKIILGIQILCTIIFVSSLYQLNVLPTLYSIILTLILLLITVGCFLGLRKNKGIVKIISIIISICLIIPISYMNKSKQAIDVITEVKDEVNRISVIVLKDSEYKHLNDLDGKNMQASMNVSTEIMKTSIEELKNNISVNLTYVPDFTEMATNLYEGHTDAIFVNEAYLWVMEHKYPNIEEEIRVIWTYEYKEEATDIKKPVAVNKDCFTIFISGIDTRGPVSTVSRSDVNMLATVNTNTNQILLTSIPRDYYVYIPELDAKDKLTHAGLKGIDSSVSTLEELLNIDINYYARINFTSLITMVDALGGITIDVPYTVGQPGWQSYFPKGVHHMNGEQALWFSRERYSLPNGDNDRILNQQRVIQAMIDKLISPKIITNYNDILDSISGSFETNMSSKEITDFLKKQLETMDAWEVQSYALQGTGSNFYGGAMMPDSKLYYCVPDEASVRQANEYINKMIRGETVKVN